MDDLFWLTLSCINGVGNKTIIKMYEKNPQMKMDEAIVELPKLSKKLELDNFVIENAKEKANHIIKVHNNFGIHVIPISSMYYPKYLKLIDDPPAVLYAKGNIDLLIKEKTVAIVGTRNPTDAGILAAKKISSTFAKQGYVIVSGLALGIDTAGHEGALRVENGETIAVLAGDLTKIYPATNKELADEILNKGGLWVSETPIGKANTRGNFVMRDRIQSGLSLGVCPVQTPIKSGTQHTINFAKKQKRLLFTPIPHESDANKEEIKGNLELINQGVLKIEDKQSYSQIEQKLNEIKISLLAEYEKRFSTTENDVNKQEEFQQINIFDML